MAVKWKSFLAMVAITVAGWIAPARMEAQYLGNVSAQTDVEIAFTNQTANGTSATFRNIGQSAHFLTICNSLVSATVVLEASTDGTFASPVVLASANYDISGVGGLDTGCHVLQAGGSYQAVRARIKNYSTGTIQVVSYTGVGSPISFAPAALSSSGPTSPVACDLPIGPSLLAQNLAATSLQGGIAGTQIYVCSLTLQFNAATTTGQIQFTSSSNNCSTTSALYTLQITANTPQTLHLTGGNGGLFRVPAGQSLCISTGAITAQTMVNAEFAQF